MSKYDEISREASAAQKPISDVYFVCGILGCLCAVASWRWLPVDNELLRIAAMLLSGVIGGRVILLLLSACIPWLKRQRDLVKSLHTQMDTLATATREFHSRLPSREKGQRFKDAHSLEGRTVNEFEEVMSSGMFKEQKEVWVSAFCRNGLVVKVFASIGSAYQCKAVEDVLRYPDHVRRLRCDEVRQYHNHPVHMNMAVPSSTDIETSRYLISLLEDTDCPLRSFIVYWNAIGEHRIIEHDVRGNVSLVKEFDVTRRAPCITLPDDSTSIDYQNFDDCTAGTVRPDNINCASTDGVLLDKELAVLIHCPASFSGEYTIPDGVTSIDNVDFQWCSALTSVTIPASVTSISSIAFHYCSALASVNVHPDNPTYASAKGILFDKDLAILIRCPVGFSGTYTIPGSLTSIGDWAFYGCSSLTSVTIPDSVTFIGDSAFSGCSTLASATIPGNITVIRMHVFWGCTALTSVSIPDGVTSIGSGAFARCSSLTAVLFSGDAPTIRGDAFNETPATIYYRPGTSGWGTTIAGRPVVEQENLVVPEEEVSCDMEEKGTEEFELADDDMYVIEIAKNVARRFLKHPNIEPREVIGLGNALYALERLPLITPGASIEFGVSYRAGTKEFSEMRYIDFRISEYVFEISKGGSVYDKAVGSDSFSEPGWSIGAGGYRREECDLYGLEDSIAEFLHLGAEISVDDESEIEYE